MKVQNRYFSYDIIRTMHKQDSLWIGQVETCENTTINKLNSQTLVMLIKLVSLISISKVETLHEIIFISSVYAYDSA